MGFCREQVGEFLRASRSAIGPPQVLGRAEEDGESLGAEKMRRLDRYGRRRRAVGGQEPAGFQRFDK
jgi:hypothetical protein